MEGEHGDDWLDVRRVGCDQPVAVFLAEEAHSLIVERDGLDPQRREIVQLMIDIDRRLKD